MDKEKIVDQLIRSGETVYENRMTEIVKNAGSVLLSNEENHLDIQEKDGFGNYVTQMDLQIQKILKKEFRILLPEAAFLAEETDGEKQTESSLMICIDPIDGTANLVHGCRNSSISVGILMDGMPVWGCVYLPYSDEMFTAGIDSGSYLNGKKIMVSGRTLQSGLVNVGTASYYKDKIGEDTMALTADIFYQALDIRRYGSAAIEMCYVACGRAEASYELRLFPWDYAAGALIVKEAGGVISDMQGRELQYREAGSFMCANPLVYETILSLCRKHIKW